MRKMMQRSLSCLLTLAMVVTMLMTSTLAAEKSAKLEFDYSANYESSKVVSLEISLRETSRGFESLPLRQGKTSFVCYGKRGFS